LEESESPEQEPEINPFVERSLVLTEQIIRLVHSARVDKPVALSALEAALSHIRGIGNPTDYV
jgi:hypothetical protein